MPSTELNPQEKNNIVIKAWSPIQPARLHPGLRLTSEGRTCVRLGSPLPRLLPLWLFPSCQWCRSGCDLDLLLSRALHTPPLVPSALHAAFIRTSFVRIVGTIPVVLCEMRVARKVLVAESKKKEKEANLWRNGSQSIAVLSGSSQKRNVTKLKEESGVSSMMNS